MDFKTLEEIIISNINIFDFDYDFYTNDDLIKSKFEEKFIEFYYDYKIGFEDISKFKRRLKATINKIMPYYVELYKTNIRMLEKDMLLNKDLIDDLSKTYLKEFTATIANTGTVNFTTDNTDNVVINSNIDSTQDGTTTLHQGGTASILNSQDETVNDSNIKTNNLTNLTTNNLTNTSESLDTGDTKTKESAIKDGILDPSLTIDGKLTTLNDIILNTENNTTDTATGTVEIKDTGTETDINTILKSLDILSTSTNDLTDINTVDTNQNVSKDETNNRTIKKDETTTNDLLKTNNHNEERSSVDHNTFKGLENESYAVLIQKWRKIIINIDELLIDDLRNLFYLFY